jgi:hypothetical protein
VLGVRRGLRTEQRSLTTAPSLDDFDRVDNIGLEAIAAELDLYMVEVGPIEETRLLSPIGSSQPAAISEASELYDSLRKWSRPLKDSQRLLGCDLAQPSSSSRKGDFLRRGIASDAIPRELTVLQFWLPLTEQSEYRAIVRRLAALAPAAGLTVSHYCPYLLP